MRFLMKKYILIILLIFSNRGNADPFERLVEVEGANAKVEYPSWVSSTDETVKIVSKVAFSDFFDSKEEALNSAWWNAVVRMGITHFPELMNISETSSESLEEESYSRDTSVNFNLINWEGLKEHSDSPFVIYDLKKKKYKAVRRIEWSQDRIKSAKNAIKLKKSYILPSAPELRSRDIAEVMNKLSIIQEEHVRESNKILTVLKNLHCGMTIEELKEIFGKPDSSYYVILDNTQKSYNWRNFSVNTRYGVITSYSDSPESKWVTLVCKSK